jgi:hypothetical protein
MGVMLGDIFVASFPATIKFAFVVPCRGDPAERDFAIDFRLVTEDGYFVKFVLQETPNLGEPITFAVPTVLVTINKPTHLRMIASSKGADEEEIFKVQIKGSQN